ncbi:MAG TPA: aromatic amino acid ammonia-lyase, partial [Acidimicrobiales bacterium]|nr:aromatic amino acid ammonia-lyase [Acidimicrobiales bacterium]
MSVSLGNERVVLDRTAIDRMRAAHQVVIDALARGDAVYGLTTGVAERKRIVLSAADSQSFSRRLIRTHQIAQGPKAPPALVRATMCCLANGFAKGYSGVRPELAQSIVNSLNEGVVPEVRTLGSVGEADLGPLADLAAGLLSRGDIELEASEGLALIDNNAFSTAAASLAVSGAERLVDVLDVAAALDLEAFAANLSALDEVTKRASQHQGLATSRDRVVSLLQESFLWHPGEARNLQDPLSFRCIPQVHGAARDAITHARQVLEVELNSAQGNPLVADGNRIVSVGGFDGVNIALVCDFVRVGLASAIGSACERSVKLLQATYSGLSAGLAEEEQDGDDALAELAVAAQSIAIEARLLAQPVSFELVSTSKAEGIEDRASMAPLSARRLDQMIELSARVVAIELVVAAQALDLRLRARNETSSCLGRGTRRVHAFVRENVPFTGRGDPPPDNLELLADAVL